MAYERDLGVAHDWNGTLKAGNPFRSDLVTQYMAFVREEQKKSGVEVSQAPALLHSHLVTIIAHMSVSTIAPPNRRLHEPENKEYSPLQAAKLKKQMRDRLAFTITSK